MADYLEAYAQRFELPVRTGVRVDALARDRRPASSIAADELAVRGRQRGGGDVIGAAAAHPRRSRRSWILESSSSTPSTTATPSQLQDGDVLIVGAGNSGADIAMEVVQGHTTVLSGRDVGHIPFPINRVTAGTAYHVVRFTFHRVLKATTRPARKIKRELAEGHGLPLVRVKPKHLTRAGVQRVPRTVGVQDGLPLLEDGRVLDVANVIWCTGFRPDFSWIDLPIFDDDGDPVHTRGIVGEPSPACTSSAWTSCTPRRRRRSTASAATPHHVVSDIAARGDPIPPPSRRWRRPDGERRGSERPRRTGHPRSRCRRRTNGRWPTSAVAEPLGRRRPVADVGSISWSRGGSGPPARAVPRHHGLPPGSSCRCSTELDGLHAVAPDRPGQGLSDPIELPRARFRDVRRRMDRPPARHARTSDSTALLGHSGGGTVGAVVRTRPSRPGRPAGALRARPPLPGTRCPLPIRADGHARRRRADVPAGASESDVDAADSPGSMGETADARPSPRADRPVRRHRPRPDRRSGRQGGAPGADLTRRVADALGFRRRSGVRAEELRSVDVQTLVMWGEHEPLGSVAVARR